MNKSDKQYKQIVRKNSYDELPEEHNKVEFPPSPTVG